MGAIAHLGHQEGRSYSALEASASGPQHVRRTIGPAQKFDLVFSSFQLTLKA
jgi:hypothetical protein